MTTPNETDDVTLNLLKEIERRKAEIAQLERPSYRTNLSFSYTEGGPPINLNTVSDQKTLVTIAAFIITSSEAFDRAAASLDVKVDYSWQGFSAQDWLTDIKTRINKSQINALKKKLEQLEARAQAVISPELRRKLELDAIKAELG